MKKKCYRQYGQYEGYMIKNVDSQEDILTVAEAVNEQLQRLAEQCDNIDLKTVKVVIHTSNGNFPYKDPFDLPLYCPHCGAKMDEVTK